VLDDHVPDLQFLAEGVGEGGDEAFRSDEGTGALLLELWVGKEEVVVDGEADLVIDQVVSVFIAEDL
jgi:hypothetical protein